MGWFSFLRRGDDNGDVEEQREPPAAPEPATRDVLALIYSDSCEDRMEGLLRALEGMHNILPERPNESEEQHMVRQNGLISLAIYKIHEKHTHSRLIDKTDDEIFGEIYAKLLDMNRNPLASRWANLVGESEAYHEMAR